MAEFFGFLAWFVKTNSVNHALLRAIWQNSSGFLLGLLNPTLSIMLFQKRFDRVLLFTSVGLNRNEDTGAKIQAYRLTFPALCLTADPQVVDEAKYLQPGVSLYPDLLHFEQENKPGYTDEIRSILGKNHNI